MTRRLRMLAALAASVAALLGAGSAEAATTYGRDCVGETGFAGPSLLLESPAGTPRLPVGGVITSWKTNVPGVSASITQRLKVAAASGAIVAETPAISIVAANAGVPTRIPVQAGQQIGLSAQAGGETFVCEEPRKGDISSYASEDTPVGATPFITSGYEPMSLPVVVTIEPDVDGDGFGDESQDSCPANPSLQSCPTIAPAPAPSPTPTPPPMPHPLAVAVAHRGSATVRVTSDVAATVAVVGRVALGDGASAAPNGGAKAIVAGGTSSFTLKFPKALTTRLAALPARRKLTLRITVTATGSGGAVGTAPVTLKLRGRG